jgi:hypothetical protein
MTPLAQIAHLRIASRIVHAGLCVVVVRRRPVWSRRYIGTVRVVAFRREFHSKPSAKI